MKSYKEQGIHFKLEVYDVRPRFMVWENVSDAFSSGTPRGEGFRIILEEIIRRLTPLKCERLQSFSDDWTDVPNASDSARYKALGNSVAIPCVDYVLYGIALVLRAG